MEVQIPTGIYEAVARDILNNKKDTFNSFQKEAATREEFLSQYNFTPEQFAKDPNAKEVIDGRLNAAAKQINDFYAMQAKSSGGLSPEMAQAKKRGLEALYAERTPAIQNRSIDRTMEAATNNPSDFQNFNNLSTQSNKALDNAYAKETGIGLGGLAGGALGFLGASKLPKNTKGILQKTIGTGLGALSGGAIGGSIGSNIDEKKTGYNHEDILQPYEIADRINLRTGK